MPGNEIMMEILLQNQQQQQQQQLRQMILSMGHIQNLPQRMYQPRQYPQQPMHMT